MLGYHQRQERTDDVLRYFFDSRVRAHEDAAAGLEHRSELAGRTRTHRAPEHNDLFWSKTEPALTPRLHRMLEDSGRTRLDAFIRAGVFFILVDLVVLNLMRKEAVAWVLHSENGGPKVLLELLEEADVMKQVFGITVEVHDQPVVLVAVVRLARTWAVCFRLFGYGTISAD